MWYYRQKKDNLNESAKIVLYMLLSIMSCYFQRRGIDSIQEFQSMVLNLENEERIQDKEMGKNKLTHKWFLTYATMPTIFMSEIVLSHPSSMIESYY